MRIAGCLGLLLIFVAGTTARSAEPAPYNAAVLKYCEAKLGKRVGGGECSHLADEALRVAGAEFTQTGANGKRIPDSPHPGDYVWGTLVKNYTFDDKTKKIVDSDAAAKCLPGDILQFNGVKTSDGYQMPHHTAIVRTVDDAGNPTGVYQQNIRRPDGSDGRIVQKMPLSPLKMISGKILVYRPHAPTNPAPMQFTWVNNSKANSVEFAFVGRKDTLGKANTAGSYQVVTGTKGADTVRIDGATYTLKTRQAYEFYSTSDGKIALREIE